LEININKTPEIHSKPFYCIFNI